MAEYETTFLGQQEKGTASVGIIAGKHWCEDIFTDKKMRDTQYYQRWKPEWSIFTHNDSEFEHVEEKCKDFKEYSDIVVFVPKHDKGDEMEKNFGFLVDNSGNEGEEEYAMVKIYSEQEHKMLFDGSFVVQNGRRSNILRCGKRDSAFILSKHATKFEKYDSAGQAFDQTSNDDVCSYRIMMTKVRGKKRERNYAVEVDDRNITDYVDGCETDSVDGCETDSGGEELYHTNVGRGQKTGQVFQTVEVEYNGAPIIFYKVVFICR